jgi:hypothetical protein
MMGKPGFLCTQDLSVIGMGLQGAAVPGISCAIARLPGVLGFALGHTKAPLLSTLKESHRT